MSKQFSLTPPEILEREIIKTHPDLDEFIAELIKLKDELQWPDWCYLPMSVSYAIITNGAEEAFAKRYMANLGVSHLHKMSAIIPWRLNKAIYDFDEGLIKNILNQDCDNVLAAAVQKMPYPCVYISNPPEIENCAGVFFFLDWERQYPEMMELRGHYLFNDGSMIGVAHAWKNDKEKLSFEPNTNYDKPQNGDLLSKVEINRKRYKQCQTMFPKHTNLLLYLCSENTDIVRSGIEPKKRGKGKIKTAAHPDVFIVGSRH